MRSPVAAMLWQIWRGWRLGFCLDFAYLLFAAVAVRMLPDFLVWAGLDPAVLPMVGRTLAMPCVFFFVHLMAAFSLTGADDLNQGGFPRKTFILPVRTWQLAGVPMVGACISVAALWLFVSGLVLRPTGNATALWWPAAAAAVGVSIIQTTAWAPLAQNWLRILLLLPPLAILAGLAAGLSAGMLGFEISDPIHAALLLGLLGATIPLGILAVAADRRGDTLNWGASVAEAVSRIARVARPSNRPFDSLFHAQTWFEFRLTGWMLPFFILLILPMPLLMILVSGGETVITLKMATLILLCPLFLGTLLGAELGTVAFPFLATRPIDDATIVRSKATAALLSAVAAHVPVFLALPFVLLRPGVREVLWDGARTAGPWRTALLVVGLPALLILFTWKGLIENQWNAMVGRKWVKLVFGIAIAFVFTAATLLGIWISLDSDLRQAFLRVAPWLAGALIAMKLLFALLVLRASVRRKLLNSGDAIRAVVVWSLTVVGLSIVIVGLNSNPGLSWKAVAVATVLLMPFARLIGAPLALAWNRHR